MISIQGLTKEFAVGSGKVAAIKDLNLYVTEGEFFVIVGASGSGKTTLLRCVAGLETPERGEIRIADRIVSSDSPPRWVPPQQRKLGMVFQSYAVWPHLTVYQNVALPLAEGTQRIARREVSNRVHEALRLVQLEDFADRSATLLSAGQQQRVALARAIAVNPKILLMDEPLSNLDARLREEVRGKIRELAKQLGSTVLYVTHDQIEAMAIADNIALMQAGQLLQVGPPMELYDKPSRAEVAEFFGSVNWLKGKIVDAKWAETSIGRIRLSRPFNSSDEVLLGFRPECLTIVEAHRSDHTNILQGTLQSSTFLGDQFIYCVEVRNQSLFGKGRTMPVKKDELITVYVDPADVMVYPADQKTGLSVLEQAPRALSA